MEKMRGMSELHLNLVLLGRTGVGKRSVGNVILRREAFVSEKGSSVETGSVCGLPVTVYDTSTESDEELRKCREVLQGCESGLSAILLVIRSDTFTEDERRTVEKIEELLEEKHWKNTWILFTGGDQVEDEDNSIKNILRQNECLKNLVLKFDGRCHMINNENQVNSLISEVIQRNLPKQQRIHINNQDVPVSVVSSRRIVLLGKSGVGKSAAGNTILGEREFISLMRMNSVTSKCSEAHVTVSGRSVSVVDTPGFFDTEMKPEELAVEIARSVYLSSPGPHAFLIVLRVDERFTEHEQKIPQIIEMMFGEEVLKYSIVLFTHGDQLKGQSVEDLIKENSRLRSLVDQCGGRYQVFNNEDLRNREQVNDLLKKIDSMVEQNGGGHYSNEMFEEAQILREEEEEERRREEEERRQEEEKRIQEELERVRKETEEKIRAEMETEKEKLQEENLKQEEFIQKKIEEELKKEREKIRAENARKEQTRSKRFFNFVSRHKVFFCLTAIACGIVVGAVAGAAVVALTVGGGSITLAPPAFAFGGVALGVVAKGAVVGAAAGGVVAGVGAAFVACAAGEDAI